MTNRLHPLVENLTIKDSLLEWIGTFDTIERKPKSIFEMIRSATLYHVLEEIDPDIFPPLPAKLLGSDPNLLTVDTVRNRAIYKEMFKQMEKWFRKRLNDDDKLFDLEIINIKRLVEQQDFNELLHLFDFIFVIVMRGERHNELIERIVAMSEKAQEDLYELIQRGANEEAEDHFDTDNFSEDPQLQKQAQALRQIERQERKNEVLREKMVDLEIENDLFRNRVEEIQKEYSMLKEANEMTKAELQRYVNMGKQELSSIDRIGKLEGEMRYKELMIEELTEELQGEKNRRA